MVFGGSAVWNEAMERVGSATIDVNGTSLSEKTANTIHLLHIAILCYRTWRHTVRGFCDGWF